MNSPTTPLTLEAATDTAEAPREYYRDEHVTLYCGNALIDPSVWTSADVLVTDPPYGLDYRSNAMRAVDGLGPRRSLPRSIVCDEDTATRDQVIAEWVAVHGPHAPAIVFGTWKIPFPAGTRTMLIWDTKGALGMGAMDLPWKPSHQQLYVLGKGFTGRRDSDVLTFAPVQAKAANGRQHPHQKPVGLMKALIDKCPPGVIADPCAGSGSTLVAAKALGRQAIGVEVDERFCEVIAGRLAQGVLPIGETLQP